MKPFNLTAIRVDGKIGNSFVGIKVKENQACFYYPESYDFNPSNYSIDDIIEFLSTIKIAKTKSMDRNEEYNECLFGEKDPFSSAVWIVQDYIRNDIFRSSDFIYKKNINGRVNWKKTIQTQPIVSHGNILFHELVSEKRIRTENILTEIHRYCIYKSLQYVGWIFGLSQDNIEEPLPCADDEPFMVSIINEKILSTYNDRKHKLLTHMKNVLTGLDIADDNQESVYGVDDYDYIFERMVDSIYGNKDTSSLNPKYTWHLEFPNALRCAATTLRLDTVLYKNNNVYIIDSKNYRYGNRRIDEDLGLPGSESIVKQIVYAKELKKRFIGSDIYNVFILPYNKKEANCSNDVVYAGFVEPNAGSIESYEKIHVVLIDLKHVVKTWNSYMHENEKEELISLVSLKLSELKEEIT